MGPFCTSTQKSQFHSLIYWTCTAMCHSLVSPSSKKEFKCWEKVWLHKLIILKTMFLFQRVWRWLCWRRVLAGYATTWPRGPSVCRFIFWPLTTADFTDLHTLNQRGGMVEWNHLLQWLEWKFAQVTRGSKIPSAFCLNTPLLCYKYISNWNKVNKPINKYMGSSSCIVV